METLYQIYFSFLGLFPEKWQFPVSAAIVVFIVYYFLKLIKKSFWYLVLLILLFPALLPIILGFYQSLYNLLKGLVVK